MGVAHLADKRSGRPKGSKNTPAWARDVRWVYKHVGDADAQPPTIYARLLLAQARERPDLLAPLLALLEPLAAKPAPEPETSPPAAPAESAVASDVPAAPAPEPSPPPVPMQAPAPRRVRKVLLKEDALVHRQPLRAHRPPGLREPTRRRARGGLQSLPGGGQIPPDL